MNEQQENIKNVPELTVAEMLKNARTTGRRKREISTIAKLLCIREEFLSALEEGNYRVIPEDVYILGFARSYAVELGLEPEEILTKLKKELGITKVEDEEEEQETVDEKQPIKINKETLLNWFKTFVSYMKKHRIWFISGASVLFVLITLICIFGGHKNTETQLDANETVVENVAINNAVKEPDFRYPVHERFETKNRKESRVVLQAEKESWVKIEDARGSSVFSRVLIPGDVYYVPLSDKYKATFGNVGAMDVWVDGQLIKKLGPANTKKTGISLAPDALKSVGLAE